MNKTIKKLFAITFAVALIIAIPSRAYAYKQPWGHCGNCHEAVLGVLDPSYDISFPYASSTSHQRVAAYLFYCDSCGHTTVLKLAVNEPHEFHGNKCECGYTGRKGLHLETEDETDWTLNE
ncbi:MAG: hypothetical protein K6E19_05620 [Lachnospiraceae bacterium]|nr:hypothetical protein [Lachnospiraceae bacterium]